MFTEKSGKPFKGYGMYAALSYDEGKTWPVKRLLTDGTYRFLNGGAWTQFFEMDENHAEPRGYLAGTQTPDNMIHLITSRFYYKFNLAWLKENQYNKVKSIYEKHFICLRIFASLWDAPFMGQFQDSLNEDQLLYVFGKVIIRILLLSVMESLIIWSILLLFIFRDWQFTRRMTWSIYAYENGFQTLGCQDPFM